MKKFYKCITSSICSILVVLLLFSGCTSAIPSTPNNETTTNLVENTTEAYTEPQPEPEKEVTISEEVQSLADNTIKDAESGKDIASDELAPIPDNESDIVDEGAIEPDAQVEQENISYDGTNTGNGKSLLGKCTGLTYYSQADSRWGSIMYSNHGDKKQTIKSGGCGATSAAMIVSSSKGVITPPTMAKLFVDNGYRTYSNGTAWSAWSFVADYFGFKEYYPTTSNSKMFSFLKTDKNKDGVSDYFVVVSVGNGLFTTGGHYIVLVADKSGIITVYDPYLYNGKFNTVSRRAANVTVSGNSVFVTETNFKKYANAKQYWIFSNDYVKQSKPTKNNSSGKSAVKKVNYTRYVATKSNPLNVRKSTSTSSKIVSTLKKGTKVKVDKVNGSWNHIISPVKGWVSSLYLSSTAVKATKSNKPKVKYKTTIGKLYRLKGDTALYSKRNLSGTKYNYKALTQVKVIKHYSAAVDYVYVVKTGRYAYVKVSALK